MAVKEEARMSAASVEPIEAGVSRRHHPQDAGYSAQRRIAAQLIRRLSPRHDP